MVETSIALTPFQNLEVVGRSVGCEYCAISYFRSIIINVFQNIKHMAWSLDLLTFKGSLVEIGAIPFLTLRWGRAMLSMLIV